MQSEKKPLVERRGVQPEHSVWWDKLTLAQKFSASSLGKFGYELQFVRSGDHGSLAVLTCNNGIATISDDGEIDTSPSIQIR
ncbi:hypothetical protein [Thalassotalea euphylliae]|uniref:Uncharacterized protein n=1 Tax=Thalassotalea euphylliae TaxID=1655234 RepID=A0A3E0UFA2_9GAMM|nr:hypothetical protein [Thalassotalea euphylliae]REL34522.1 hypothetical protein DXX92_03660 [Thalassotalea euphylliae]